MNTINYAAGHIIIPLGDLPIFIDGIIYKHLTVVARLLNVTELKRIDRTMTSDAYQKEVINDEIFRACVVDILGVNKAADLDNSSAGLVSIVAEAIYNLSVDHVVNAIKYSEEYKSQVTLIDNMTAVISKFLNINYLEVTQMPINRIFELYAVCRTSFPNQVSDIMEQEEEKEQTGAS